MTTDQYAEALGIKPGTLIKAHAQKGSYFGATPTKALNGRLTWPKDELPRLKGESK